MKEKGVEVELRKERIAKNYLSGNADLLGNPDLEQGMGVICIICVFVLFLFLFVHICIHTCTYLYMDINMYRYGPE